MRNIKMPVNTLNIFLLKINSTLKKIVSITAENGDGEK